MVKPILLVFLLANIFLFVASIGRQKPKMPWNPPQRACRLNEVWSNCPIAVCRPKTCTDVGFPIACVDLKPDGKCPVKPGCICKEGYVRNFGHICIPMKHCSSCGGDNNAVAGCGNCNKRCSDIGKEPVFCTQICYENGCDCKDGLYYDDNTKKCVLSEQCTPTCGPDEVYDECVQGNCNPKNCSQLGFPVACPKIDSRYCIKGCLCKQGYLRNDKGVCIPIQQCPSCGGDPNAESGCGNYCGNQCSDYTKKNITCPLACQLNGCKCRKGYVYDSNTKKCVLPKHCTPVCKIDEVYSDCINRPCPVQNCSLNGITVLCVDVDPKDCKKGCPYKPQLMKEDDGSCVSIADCKPITCNKPNEYFEPCDYGCPPQTCESLDMAYACPIREGDTCKARCKCKPGYFRNKLGDCITEAQCRKCMGPYEYFSCGGACDNVCATLDKQNQTNCPIINIICNEMCYCEKDYARANNGTCIPIKQCKGDRQPYCNMSKKTGFPLCRQFTIQSSPFQTLMRNENFGLKGKKIRRLEESTNFNNPFNTTFCPCSWKTK